MLVKEPQVSISVYSITNTAITLIGEVIDFSSLQYATRFIGYGNLEMYVPLTADNVEYCKIGNMLLINTDGHTAYIITSIENQKDEAGFVKVKVQGRGLEHLLSYRCIYQTLKYDNDHISTIMYDMVNENFINVEQSERELPHLVCATDEHFGEVAKLQRSGKTVKDRLDDLCNQYNLGYDVYFDISAKLFVFKVNQRIDRSINQNINEHVIFDTDNQDILTSTFMHNVADEKNVGLVVGEDQMDSSQTAKIRVKLPVGDDTLFGYNRKEIYIDARDLQSEYENNTGTVENMSDEEYANLLADRGAKKLAENVAVQSFEANIRYYYSQYEYGVDYNVGDVVTFIDRDMGVTVSAFISEVEQVFTDYYELRLSIGYDRPTIYSRIARMLNT